MHRSLFLFSGIFLCLGAQSALADGPVGLDALSAYAGTWKTEIHNLDTPYSKKSDSSYELRNDCWRSAAFYACDQFVGGDSKAFLVFTYDPKRGYTSYPITSDSGDTLHSGRLVIEGHVWTFPWKDVKDGKTTYFHVTNTWDSPDSIQFRQEYSTDGEHWTLMAHGHETRIQTAGKQP
jgi:hypothetical protein